jgi:arylsulfatase
MQELDNLGTVGNSIKTSHLDSWDVGCLAYNNMYTAVLYQPRRLYTLIGRNHHSYNMFCVTEGSTGYPGYNRVIPFEQNNN